MRVFDILCIMKVRNPEKKVCKGLNDEITYEEAWNHIDARGLVQDYE